MTDIQSASVTPMDDITVRLGDLGLAPENLRFQEPADDGVPQLAETVLAAGVLIPPIVRAGRKGEQPFMALDGRRRASPCWRCVIAATSTTTIPSSANWQ